MFFRESTKVRLGDSKNNSGGNLDLPVVPHVLERKTYNVSLSTDSQSSAVS